LKTKNMSWRPAHICEFQLMLQMFPSEYLFFTQCRPTATCRAMPPVAEFDANRKEFGYDPSTLSVNLRKYLSLNGFQRPDGEADSEAADHYQTSSENYGEALPPVCSYRHGDRFSDNYGFLCICLGWCLSGVLIFIGCGMILDRRRGGRIVLGTGLLVDVLATASGFIGCLPWNWRRCLTDSKYHGHNYRFHGGNSVKQKSFLTSPSFRNTLIAVERGLAMANVLNKERQAAIIGALAEGSSIRSIERMTGIHRDTIMRLGVRLGRGCAALLDERMQGLSCRHLQFDEIWGFIGKKERHLRQDDDPQYGDVWTFCAIDADTKLVPSFKVGKRNAATANAFVTDVASRLKNRVQISSDALRAYVEAVEQAFGADVDYAQIVKTFAVDDSSSPERKYSPSEVVSVERTP